MKANVGYNFCLSGGVSRTIVRTCIVLMTLLILPESHMFSQIDPLTQYGKLRDEIGLIKNDSLKIEKLFDLAFFYFDYLGDDYLADSASGNALRLAEESHQPELLVIAYCRYIESNNLSSNYKKALGYALKAEQLSNTGDPRTAFRITKNLVSVYLSGYEYDKALEYSYKALSLATMTENVTWKAEGYLDIGKCLEGKNQKIEAFRNYLNAEGLAQKIKDTGLQIKCAGCLSTFYNLNKIYNQATRYKLVQCDLLRKMNPVDSNALMLTQYDLQVIDLNSNNNQLDDGSIRKILDFAVRKKFTRLQTDEIALIRTHLIQADKIGLLHELYSKEFPHELEKMASENPGMYYRLRAFFCEEEHRPDSALYYFNKAELTLQTNPNKVLRANFFNRFGQFFLRRGLKDKAIEKFSDSYKLACESGYFDYMLSVSRQLETLYAGKGDFRNAFNYAVLNRTLSDSINKMSKKDQLLIMEIEHETRQRDLSAESEKQSTERRHYLQYNAIIVIIISVFIVLLMLGSLKVSEWIIKMLGFFSFIFLFEFIVLIADHKIHEITQGEPWKILLIKICLIAILLPMHHWIEKRVVAFLLNPGLINISRYPVRSKLRAHLSKLKPK
jgi:hypothetical protein